MSESTEQALVVFTPSGKRGQFPIGTSILSAARTLGVDLDTVCGGRRDRIAGWLLGSGALTVKPAKVPLEFCPRLLSTLQYFPFVLYVGPKQCLRDAG